ncbi:MAG: hypothetical protein ACTSYD_09335 [Candidatus Heimdallarchaeaceae archaeon]
MEITVTSQLKTFNMQETSFCFRVDIDTYYGLRKGLHSLIQVVKKMNIPITIYVTLGKFQTGKNLIKHLKHRKKIISAPVRIWQRNHPIDLLRGILLPSKSMSKKDKKELYNIFLSENIEIHAHGYDHVEWAYEFNTFSYEKTRWMLNRLIEEYKSIFGFRPVANAAPNFNINKYYLNLLNTEKFVWSSDILFSMPFYPRYKDICSENTITSNVVQLPVTELSIYEMLTRGYTPEKIKDYLFNLWKKKIDEGVGYICFYLHAIFEPLKLPNLLKEIFNFVQSRELNVTSHSDFIANCKNIPVIDVKV